MQKGNKLLSKFEVSTRILRFLGSEIIHYNPEHGSYNTILNRYSDNGDPECL